MVKKILIIVICAFLPLVAFGQKNVRTIKVRGVSFQMVKVEGGIYDMGAEPDQTLLGVGVVPPLGGMPIHEERVNSFFIGQTEVTQQLWKAVMGRNTSMTDSPFVGDSLPVIDLDYEACIEFIDRLNELTKLRFRLPTEAEWEFAARGGIKSKGYRYSGSDYPDDVAWWGAGHAGNRCHAVATKQPNELGLYDMSGNVGERCGDESAVWNNRKLELISPDFRVNPDEVYVTRGYALRGGGMANGFATGCRVLSRWITKNHYNGLRLVLDTSDRDKGIYTIKNEDGVKLDYIKLTESTVALTYNEKRDADISGTLHIPAVVSIKGQQYKVTTIGDKALSNNPRLKSVFIPATVNRIGIHALTNCDNLEQIVVDGQNSVLDSREGSNAIIDTDRRMVVRGCKASTIPEGIRHIGPYAFYQCQSLTGIQLPKSLLSIRDFAFMGCSQLTSVALPPNLILIDDFAFANTALQSVTIPPKFDQTLMISEGAFFETQIDEVTIPANVGYIGNFAFYRSDCQTKMNFIEPKSIALGNHYVKNQTGNIPEQPVYELPPLAQLTENDPIGLYHLTKVTYDDGTVETVPDFEQYKYCARAITLTSQLEHTDDGVPTLQFVDNDHVPFRHTGNVAVGTNGRGIRIYDSNQQHFTLKWFNSNRAESELFPRDKFINELYDAKEGVEPDVRQMMDILETYSNLPTSEEASSLTGVWLRVGIIKMRNGVIEKFLPTLENQKYKLFDHQQVVDLYTMYCETSSRYTEEVAYHLTTRIRPFRYDSSAQTLTEGKRTTHIDWKASDTFLLPFATEDNGTEYAELYEYSQLPERITNIFASKNISQQK